MGSSVVVEKPATYPFMQELAQQFEYLKGFNSEIFPNHLLHLEEMRACASVCACACVCVRACLCEGGRGEGGMQVCMSFPVCEENVFFGGGS